MVVEIIRKMQDKADDFIRGIVGRLTPGKRLIVVIAMFIVFGFGSIYITAISIYRIGKAHGLEEVKGSYRKLDEVAGIKELEKLNETKDSDYEK